MGDWKQATGGDMSKAVRWEKEGNEKSVYVGEVVQGVYKRRKENVGINNSNVYEIITEEHGLLGVWGTTVLDSIFEEIPVGAEVRIEHKGIQASKKPGGKGYHAFDVNYREVPMKSAGVSAETASGSVTPPLPPV